MTTRCVAGLNWCGGGCDACSDTPATLPQIGYVAYSARMTNHHEAALAHIDNVTTAREQIRDVYANPTAPGASARLAILNAQCGDSLKLAEVHATLAVMQAVEQLGLAL